jgi:hypothetical protein
MRVYRVRLKGATAKTATTRQPANRRRAISEHKRRPAVAGCSWQSEPAAGSTIRALQLFFSYAVMPIVALLLAHYLIVMKLDLDTSYLRVFSLALPAIVGFTLFWEAGRGLGAALLLGATTGIVSVFGMLAIVGLVIQPPSFPLRGSNGRKRSNTQPELPSRP